MIAAKVATAWGGGLFALLFILGFLFIVLIIQQGSAQACNSGTGSSTQPTASGIAKNQIPGWLIPIYQGAGAKYGIPWVVLAAINYVETTFGTNLSTSSAGAVGWMQFEPSTWSQYGVTPQGTPAPYGPAGWNNPADAIYSAANYLKASGGDTNIQHAIFIYNHSGAYVSQVMGLANQYAQGGYTPSSNSPMPAAAGASGACAADMATVNADGYVSPFTTSVTPSRVDQGVDYCMPVGAKIRVMGNAKVVNILPNWYAGQPLIYYELLNGPFAGKYVYVSEEIDNLAQPGQVLQEGQTIAQFAPSGTCIETGWADASGATLAHVTSGYTEGQTTGAGVSFNRFMMAFKIPSARINPPVIGAAPAGYP